MIIKKISLLAASIIKIFIIFFCLNFYSKAEENSIKNYSNDEGILSLMYHRFNENKYPSTNIQMDIFDKQMQIIENLGFEFYNPKIFINEFDKTKKNKKILLTIDDGFKSFYTHAWPYLKKKIKFHLFFLYLQNPQGKKDI